MNGQRAANPYGAADPDRRALWAMLVTRDIEAFVASDFDCIAGDFDPVRFSSIDARGSADPDLWSLALTEIDDYKAEWLRQAEQFRRDFDDPAAVLYAATAIDQIEINGAQALVHKRFDHLARARSGALVPLRWRTVYQCRRSDADPASWRITGFVGFLPLAAESAAGPVARSELHAPSVGQHRTAGAYSPVLTVVPGRLAVISGQAALDEEGRVMGSDVETQTEHTLTNCRRLLAAAGLGLSDVFKANVYLADIADWEAFNRTYRRLMPAEPLPVRTAVGVSLLPGLKVEVEMWAAG
jgi:enamine deaminase RidA (YjgF/YER057c/UK114 family)